MLGKIAHSDCGKTKVEIVPVDSFDGEYRRRSFFYIFVLWLVSILAMITNVMQVLPRFIREKRAGDKPSLSRLLFRLGRRESHVSSFFVDRFSRLNHEAKCGSANWRALRLYYGYIANILPTLRNNPDGFLTRFWIGGMENRQAVANRKKIVVSLLVEAIKNFAREQEIRLVSVASGSAEAVIEAMQKTPGANVKALLIDTDRSAIAEAERLIAEAGLGERFIVKRGSFRDFWEDCEDFKPHIVEMVGLLDYLSDEVAGKLISDINNVLVDGGMFLTCNIDYNREKIFLDWVLLWPMVYRGVSSLRNMLIGAGFSSESIRIISCPFRIHHIARCVKQSGNTR